MTGIQNREAADGMSEESVQWVALIVNLTASRTTEGWWTGLPGIVLISFTEVGKPTLNVGGTWTGSMEKVS